MNGFMTYQVTYQTVRPHMLLFLFIHFFNENTVITQWINNMQ